MTCGLEIFLLCILCFPGATRFSARMYVHERQQGIAPRGVCVPRWGGGGEKGTDRWRHGSSTSDSVRPALARKSLSQESRSG